MSEAARAQRNSTSLQDYDDLVGRIHLHIAPEVATIAVLVEGKSDELAISDIVDRKQIFRGGPKRRLLEVGAQLWTLGDQKFVCVFDRDFDSVTSADVGGFLCHPYDGVDLENAVLELGVAERLIETVASEQKLSTAGGPDQVVDMARHAVEPISSLRRANAIQAWGMPFDQMVLEKYVEPDGSLDIEKYLRALLHARPVLGAPTPPRLDELKLAARGGTPTGLYRGRDLLQVLAKYLRMAFLRHRKSVVATPESLEATVHTAASSVLALSEWALELRRLCRISQARPPS